MRVKDDPALVALLSKLLQDEIKTPAVGYEVEAGELLILKRQASRQVG